MKRFTNKTDGLTPLQHALSIYLLPWLSITFNNINIGYFCYFYSEELSHADKVLFRKLIDLRRKKNLRIECEMQNPIKMLY